MRILVIEDDDKTAGAISEGLRHEHYEVTRASTGEEGFFELSSTTFDLVILDLMLPGRSGLEIAQTLRKRGDQTPVLMLTARDAVEDRVRGFDCGADDYLVKPFAFSELLARIRAILRRGRGGENLRLRVGDLELELLTRKVTRSARVIELTAREYELLEYLMRREKQIVSRSELAKEVWKEPDRATPIDNLIDVHVARLRKKIDAGASAKLIHTQRGAGFMLSDQHA